MIRIEDEQFRNICGETYRRMVETAMRFSDAVMLVYHDCDDHPMSEQEREIRTLLSPYLLVSRNNGQTTPEHPNFAWPGTLCGYRDPTDPAELFFSGDSRTYVDTYELADLVKDVILSVDSFGDWLQSKGRPMDISFFKSCECWFYTTVHDDFLAFDDFEEAFFEILHDGGIEYTYYCSQNDRRKRFLEPYRLE